MSHTERILDLWALGKSSGEIAEAVGISRGGVARYVALARERGDRRAKRRGLIARQQAPAKSGHNWLIQMAESRRLAARMMLGRKFPASEADLRAAIDKAKVPVTKCPPGIAAVGFKPSWM